MACETCDYGEQGCGAGGTCDNGVLPVRTGGDRRRGSRLCVKCKKEFAVMVAGNQSHPICKSCLHVSLLAKFKAAINNNGLILPSDKILVALSGGPSSRVALELLKEIQLKAEHDAGLAKDRGLGAFELGAVFVDERKVLQLPPADVQAGMDEIRSIFLEEDYANVPVHVVELERIYKSNEEQFMGAPIDAGSIEMGRKQEAMDDDEQKLVELFHRIPDATGKEDLLEFLRMQAIQKVAQEQGYTKVVLGLSTTRIAARVISATTKGRGFSLSADIQYRDARWPVPVVLPLRDCSTRQLALFCHFSMFKTVFIKGSTTMANPRSSLNSLAHSFVTLLQEENSSREQTIVRTAAKLKSFGFNKVTPPPNRRQNNSEASDKDFTRDTSSALDVDFLCSVCKAPMKDTSAWDIRLASPTTGESPVLNSKSVAAPLAFRNTCCPSCQFQILQDDELYAAKQYRLFPGAIIDRNAAIVARREQWMRAQIESYLPPEENES